MSVDEREIRVNRKCLLLKVTRRDEMAEIAEVQPADYTESDIDALVVSDTVKQTKYVLDFDRLWPVLGYGRRDHAIDALRRGREGGL